ncbi:hypothetical protein FKM82_000953 [Ascaphus truei]
MTLHSPDTRTGTRTAASFLWIFIQHSCADSIQHDITGMVSFLPLCSWQLEFPLLVQVGQEGKTSSWLLITLSSLSRLTHTN